MTFEEWKAKLADALWHVMRIPNGEWYIQTTGDECWREMYDDGLSPMDAANEEAVAIRQS